MLTFHKACIDLVRWSLPRARGIRKCSVEGKEMGPGATEEADYVSEDRGDSRWRHLKPPHHLLITENPPYLCQENMMILY